MNPAAVTIYKEGNGKREISRFYNNIGTIFCLYGDFGNGLGYYIT